MIIRFSKPFAKQIGKLSSGVESRFKERLMLFTADAFHPLLHNHALTGQYQGYRSINITGDYRAIFEPLDNDTVLFVAIGTHSKLYKI